MNNKYNLIGLTGIAENKAGERIGSARVGKDEIGKYLSEVVHTHTQLSFAAPIYEIAHSAFGIPKVILENPSKFQKEEQVFQPWGMTLREILQTIGTELFRDKVDKDFWVKRLAMSLEDCNRAVVADVRMDNEANFIRDRGGIIIHVHRVLPDDLGKIRAHRSEQQVEVLPNDAHIYNYGDLQDLSNQIKQVILNQL